MTRSNAFRYCTSSACIAVLVGYLQGLVVAESTSLVSLSSLGVPGNGHSQNGAISDDGRYVVFVSTSTNLVVGDTNSRHDVFLRDTLSGATQRVSVGSNGGEGDFASSAPAISGNGLVVAFYTRSALVEGDTNGLDDVYVRDVSANTIERISLAADGSQGIEGGSGFIYPPSISHDGRYVAFGSHFSNLVPGDGNGVHDIFVRDRLQGTTSRVSVGGAGIEGNNDSWYPSLSSDGRFVAFFSYASNLVSGDTNSVSDVFVRDIQAGTTIRASVGFGGLEANADCFTPSIGINGDVVAFMSYASNLTVGDENGAPDIFVWDVAADHLDCISVTPAGATANGWSARPDLTPDGRYVAFHSAASNLVGGDGNGYPDVFLYDRDSRRVEICSVTSIGQPAGDFQYSPNFGSAEGAVSSEGRYVLFTSAAANLDNMNGVGLDVFLRDRTAHPSFCNALDGVLGACPCGQGASAAGCDNSQATGGVSLGVLAQSSSLSAATLQGVGFSTMGAPAAIVIRSNALDPSSPVVFGDGLRCINTSPLVRLAATTASGGISTHVFGHGAMAGVGTFYYQLWYRNTPSSYCTPAAFNLSSGRTLVW